MNIDANAVVARYNKMLDEMVNRFLCRKLPKDFDPDGGISFKEGAWWPTGTNLLTAEQARQMFKECVPPSCFGLDDCSTQALSVCTFADKCGK